MPSWRHTKHLPAVLLLAAFAFPARPAGPVRANELTLSGLRPGRDARATAEARYPGGATDGSENSLTWRDNCQGRELRMEFGGKGVLDSVTVSAMPEAETMLDCKETPWMVRAETWRTGRGLALGEAHQRALAIYGAPESRGPSTREGQELEFLFYAFDWAGSNVPQVMEISYDRKTGRVVQITLAFPSL
jgi:hypothetical protein